MKYVLLLLLAGNVVYADQGSSSFATGFASAIDDALRARMGQAPAQPVPQAQQPVYTIPVTPEFTNPAPFCVQDSIGTKNCIYYSASNCRRMAASINGLCVGNSSR